MIGLIKNELIKLIKNKTFYISLFLIFLFPICELFLGTNLNHVSHSYESLTNEYKITSERAVSASPEFYIDAIYKYQLLRDGKRFNDNYKKALQLISNDYFANQMYLTKNDNDKELFNYYKNKYDLVLNTIETNDLENSISKIKDIYISTLDEQQVLYDSEDNSYNKDIIKNRIDYLNNFISNYQYVVKYKNELNNDKVDILPTLMYNVNKLYTYGDTKDNIEENYRDSASYLISKYKLDNNYLFLSYYDEVSPINLNYSNSSLTDLSADNSLFLMNIFIIFVVCISLGGVISSEYEKNTVKQLLIRPFSRTKILISKILASFIYVTILSLINCLSFYIVFGIIRGFDFNPIILLNIKNGITVYNPIVFYLIDVVSLLPFLYIYTMILLFVSELTKSTLGTNILVFIIWFFNYMLTSIIMNYGLSAMKYLKFNPLSNCDIKTLIFIHQKAIPGQSLLLSFISWIIIISILFILTNKMIEKDEIKNLEK